MASKFKVHCHVRNYIEETYPDISAILEGTCVTHSLNTKGKTGVTFVVPQDKTLIKKLEQLAYSASPEEYNKAGAILQSCIFRDVFKVGGDWTTKKPVVNSLYPAQIVEVASSTATTVTFKNGAVAELDKGFVDGSPKKNQAVWILKSGELPVTTDKPADLAAIKKAAKATKAGGYNPSTEDVKNIRFAICMAVESEYVACMQASRGVLGGFFGGGHRDPYCEAVCSLICFLKKHAGDECIAKIAPLICWSKMDFYILVEPHRRGNDYIIPSSYIQSWWANHATAPHSMEASRKIISDAVNEGGSASTGRRAARQAVFDATAKLRKRILEIEGAATRDSLSSAVEAAYRELEQQNKIGVSPQVFPEELHQYYMQNPGLKLIHDELRYRGEVVFRELQRDVDVGSGFDVGGFAAFASAVGDSLHASTETERRAQLRIVNKIMLSSHINNSSVINTARGFVNSVFFLFIHYEEDECKGFAKYVAEQPAPDRNVFFSPLANYYEEHRELGLLMPKMDQNVYKEAVDALMGIDLPDHVKRILKDHGLNVTA